VNLGTPHVNFDRSHSNEPYSDVLGHIQISTNGELKAGPPKVERVTEIIQKQKRTKT
jgi:hypothetical protein